MNNQIFAPILGRFSLDPFRLLPKTLMLDIAGSMVWMASALATKKPIQHKRFSTQKNALEHVFFHMQHVLLQHNIVIVGKRLGTHSFLCIFLRYLGELYNYNFDTQGCWRVESQLRYPCPPSFEVTSDFTNLIVAPNPKSIVLTKFTTAKLCIHTYGCGSKWSTPQNGLFPCSIWPNLWSQTGTLSLVHVSWSTVVGEHSLCSWLPFSPGAPWVIFTKDSGTITPVGSVASSRSNPLEIHVLTLSCCTKQVLLTRISETCPLCCNSMSNQHEALQI